MHMQGTAPRGFQRNCNPGKDMHELMEYVASRRKSLALLERLALRGVPITPVVMDLSAVIPASAGFFFCRSITASRQDLNPSFLLELMRPPDWKLPSKPVTNYRFGNHFCPFQIAGSARQTHSGEAY
jgi:hypothetical protein